MLVIGGRPTRTDPIGFAASPKRGVGRAGPTKAGLRRLGRGVRGGAGARGGGHIGAAELKRLARRGGVKRISRGVFAEARACLEAFVRGVVGDAAVYAGHARRRTATVPDVLLALKRRGIALYGHGDAIPPPARVQVRVRKLVAPLPDPGTPSRTTAASAEGGSPGPAAPGADTPASAPAGPARGALALVQEALGRFFLRERVEVCSVEAVRGEVEALARGTGRAAPAPGDIRSSLERLAEDNRVMLSAEEIYLI